MSSLGGVVVVVVTVALLVVVIALARSRRVTPWPSIMVAAVVAGICVTLGGNSGRDATEPNVATVMAAAAGLLIVVAATLALVPHVARPPWTRLPAYVATAAAVVATVGVVLNQLG